MTIKEKVLSSCKTSFAKYGLKKDELSKLVDTIIATRGLTDESKDADVESAISVYEPSVGLMQAMYNRAVSETEKKYEGYVKPEPVTKEPITQNATIAHQALTTEEVQRMISETVANNQKAISEAVAAAIAPFKEKEEKARLSALLQGCEKLKSVPQQFRSRYTLDKEDNLDAVAQQCVDDWTTLKQDIVASGQFVEAPKVSSPQSEQDNFIKQMQGFAERNAPQASK